VAQGWQQQQVAENAELIWKEGSDLFDRLKTFSEHMCKIRDGLQKATQAYNNALSSGSRVLPCAYRLKDLGGPQHERELPEIEHVDTYLCEPRDVASSFVAGILVTRDCLYPPLSDQL
jgi:DNA recombination protein RmuC